MTVLQRTLESGAPVSRPHERQSYDPADFPVPPGARREPPGFGGGRATRAGGRFTVWRAAGIGTCRLGWASCRPGPRLTWPASVSS
jgi:hypothetical protein